MSLPKIMLLLKKFPKLVYFVKEVLGWIQPIGVGPQSIIEVAIENKKEKKEEQLRNVKKEREAWGFYWEVI